MRRPWAFRDSFLPGWDDTTPGAYLHHQSARGEFHLTSDSACQTWTRIGWSKSWTQRPEVIPHIPESELEQFLTTAHQIGGKMLFPGKMINGRTINQERGTNRQIADRFDLTLECIRLNYLGETSPLAEVLIRNVDFFALFEDFNGYTDFFLLQDLVSEDSSAVKFFLPFTHFGTSPLPPTVEAYQDYRRNAIRFVEARNRRMAEYVVRL
jgi:Family of unknown function (DUF6994)